MEHAPDLAIVDVRMPPTFTDEGLRAAVAARERLPGLPILVLSQYVEESYAVELVAGGAQGIGYLLKERVADVAEFVAAVRTGGRRWDVHRPGSRSRNCWCAGGIPLPRCQPRERDVLELMAQGMTNAGIAGSSWCPTAPWRSTSATSSPSSAWSPITRSTGGCGPC